MRTNLKKLIMVGSAFVLLLSSCGGGAASSYQPEKIKEISENIKNNGGTESDYNFLIDQLAWITKNIESKKAEADSAADPEKAKELKKETQEMALTVVGIGVILKDAEDKGTLPEGSVKKLEKLEAELK